MQSPVAKPTVLVVEDEMLLRMRAVDIVEDAGFTPLEAVNADTAMSLLETRPEIELLFTDIQMPGSMDGLKLAHAVHERWPAIKIILVSGQVSPSEADRPADSRFFPKPVEVRQMVAELQDMIGDGSLQLVPNTTAGDRLTSQEQASDANASREILSAEVDSLRVLLEQAGIDAEALLIQAGIEADEREKAARLQRLILEELHHRIKNTLATVRAITSQSLRTAISIEHGQQAIDSRLAALGHAHDLLMKSSWTNASLSQIIQHAIAPYEGQTAGRFVLDGTDLKIVAAAVIAFSMTLNELCTNATKFGALSTPTGEVNISWSVDPATERFAFKWRESGGPTTYAPIRRSFGTRLIGTLGQQLQGDVQLHYEPSGFVFVLDVPLSSLLPKEPMN